MALYNKISKGPSIIQWPQFFNARASDLILKLMETDPSKRYGNMKNGADDVFTHPWFKEVIWKNLLTKNISPPYIPRTISDGDASAYVVSVSVSPLPSTCTDLICCSVSNDTQRTKPHLSTEGPGWTSSAIFSKNGITRREASHVMDLRLIRFCSCSCCCVHHHHHHHPQRYFPVSSNLISTIILPLVAKATLKMYAQVLCFPTYLNVFCIIYLAPTILSSF